MSGNPAACPDQLCHNGACRTADLTPLLEADVRWLWEPIAARADQRGNAVMDSGTITITTPHSPAQRAAVVGLLAPRAWPAGVSRRIDLHQLTLALRRRGPGLTPGAVAAHAAGRPLAQNAADKAQLAARLASLQHLRARLSRALPPTAPVRPDEAGWDSLRRRGTLARIMQHPHPERLLNACFAVLQRLPASDRADRRVLAHAATGNPHTLDPGSDLACLVIAEATAAGRTDAGAPAREAWARLGIDLDAFTGGLLTLGVHPEGWHIPPRQPIVLTPWVLRHALWPGPRNSDNPYVFISENPSVAAAALDCPPGSVRLLCTIGTPSAVEIDAIARLAASGWRIAVRADFDCAGLALVRAVLRTVPEAQVWGMTAADYVTALHPTPFEPGALDIDRLGDTPWDPTLVAAIRAHGRPAYEEAFIDQLLTDLRHGHPATNPPATSPTTVVQA
ncbi:DUF2399 domain-containing protein [Streptomyces sp. ISL-99]|uniref:DUF2399 domain-containing protein n=1 Tax=Streptomyces sp. ISL-99 TaxID=2819193 RepID=UPI001BEA4C3C|nr:DUF2399 domain-containing protein [Streptomyces sp. ISL-99]MBT2526982.1 DUF2399 domain-containing protein [Streptomyces sp. ISL-99]